MSSPQGPSRERLVRLHPRAAAVLAVLVALGGCRPRTDEDFAEGAGQVRLGAERLRAELAGNTAHGMSTLGIRFYELHSPDSVLRSRRGTGTFKEILGQPETLGTWRILPDGTLCARVSAESQETCERIYVARGKFFAYLPTGALRRTFVVRPGPPAGP